jgi:hypothetical protein
MTNLGIFVGIAAAAAAYTKPGPDENKARRFRRALPYALTYVA